MKTEHHTTPWVANGVSIHDAQGLGVATCGFNTGRTVGEKHAAIIVERVNSHAALVARAHKAECEWENLRGYVAEMETHLKTKAARVAVLTAALGEAVEWLRHLRPEDMADTKPGTAHRINLAFTGGDPYGPAVQAFVNNASILAKGGAS